MEIKDIGPGPEWEPVNFISALLEMKLSCWLLWTKTFITHWGGLQLSCFTAGMRVGISKSKAGQGWLSFCPRSEESSCLKLRSLSISESSSGVRMTGELVQQPQSNSHSLVVVLVCCGKDVEEALKIVSQSTLVATMVMNFGSWP